MKNLKSEIENIIENTNIKPSDTRRMLSKEILEAFRDYVQDCVFNTVVDIESDFIIVDGVKYRSEKEVIFMSNKYKEVIMENLLEGLE